MDPAIRQSANLIAVGDPQILARGGQQVGLDIPSLRLIDAEDSLEITEGKVLHLSITVDRLADAPMTASTVLCLCHSTKNRSIWAAMIFPTNWGMPVTLSN